MPIAMVGMANPQPQPKVSWMYDMTVTPNRLPVQTPKYHHWKKRLFFVVFFS